MGATKPLSKVSWWPHEITDLSKSVDAPIHTEIRNLTLQKKTSRPQNVVFPLQVRRWRLGTLGPGVGSEPLDWTLSPRFWCGPWIYSSAHSRTKVCIELWCGYHKQHYSIRTSAFDCEQIMQTTRDHSVAYSPLPGPTPRPRAHSRAQGSPQGPGPTPGPICP